jgi:hypothetical protein
MSKMLTKIMFMATAFGALALLPDANAAEWSQRTILTFSGPVEIPGQILPAGTYVFKLANSSSNRYIVQVFNKDENRIFGTFLAIPNYRLNSSDKTVVTFEERPAGSPPALKVWFYPGKLYGQEFVYPKAKAVALAKANNTPVPFMPAELTADTTKPALTLDSPEVEELEAAPVKAEEPDGQEVELAAVFGTPETVAFVPPASLPEELPTTASPLPLIGLLGLLSLGTAVTLRVASAKAK